MTNKSVVKIINSFSISVICIIFYFRIICLYEVLWENPNKMEIEYQRTKGVGVTNLRKNKRDIVPYL